MRVALAVIAALGAILLFLLASASANTALFAENYPWLLAINGVAAIALLALVGLRSDPEPPPRHPWSLVPTRQRPGAR